MLPRTLANQLARRAFNEVPLQLQHSHPWRELARVTPPRWPLLQRHEYGPLSIDGVYRHFDRQLARRISQLKELRAVYLYEDAARYSFEVATRLGVSCIYDLPIGHWNSARKIYEEERELQPGWSPTLTGLKDSSSKRRRKDEELALADLVIVPSAYVRETLIQARVDASKIRVVPFGAPAPLTHERATNKQRKAPLRVLFVGSLGQRKGLSYALEAVAALGSEVSLTLIGRPTAKECRPLNEALEQHQWIASLPHHQILEQMRQHDVLLFPTLFDGFGLVITEALSQGLPVITTANSGAPECIRDGVEGFIVPIRSSQAIAECLQQLVNDREQLARMSRACIHRADELSWSGYEQGLSFAVGQLLLGEHTEI
jgi:alpha-maltose-1-phosphate synthase